jgi:Spy/CpxP family protein refolding chaperone
VQLTFWNGPCVGRLRFHERIFLRQMTMPRISYCMETNFANAIKGMITALVVTGFFITSPPSLCAEAGAGVIQTGPGMYAPTLETLQRGLEDMLDRLGLTHAQREQVEQIMAGEAMQLQMTRGNPNLSVAQVFTQEQKIRIQTRRQIASMLSPKQTQKLTEFMMRKIVKSEDRVGDY